jgi:hypothetical protein
VVARTVQRCATRSRARSEIGEEREAMIGDTALAAPTGNAGGWRRRQFRLETRRTGLTSGLQPAHLLQLWKRNVETPYKRGSRVQQLMWHVDCAELDIVRRAQGWYGWAHGAQTGSCPFHKLNA